MQAVHIETKQPLVTHLIELRKRLLYSVAFVLMVFVGLFAFANDLYLVLSEPLRHQLPDTSTMIATEVASPFLTPFKLSLVLSIFISVPFILFQLWLFVRPGLKKREVKVAIPMLLASIFLFYLGVAFAYFVVFPLVFAFFSQVAPEGVAVMTDISSYLNFVIKLFFAFGFAFEVPIVAMLLILLGATTRESLASKRPYVFVGCFVIGMLLTPPDILSQFLLAIPMWLLFELGLLITRFIQKNDNTKVVQDKSLA